MTTIEIKEYYDTTKDREVRSDLKFAVSLVDDSKIAIDCGCGAGSDIAYLRSQGFTVYGFDVEEESIARCKARFILDSEVFLSIDSFRTFKYPNASLVLADASLFFCPKHEFFDTWNSIYECLCPNGIFCGSFLGPHDTMASQNYNRDAFWPEVLIYNESEVRSKFTNYEICSFTEHRSSGKTPQGEMHEWHIYSVVAKKTDNAIKLHAFSSGLATS